MGDLAKKACNGVIEVGGTAVVELRSWAYRESSKTEHDFSTMGACGETIVPGAKSARLELTLYFASPTDATQDSLQQGAEGIAVDVMPFGDTVGLAHRTGDINVLERSESGDVEGGVEVEISATAPAGLTLGAIT